jgi:hypothetical protein
MAANPLKVSGPHDRQTIVCIHCHQPMEIGIRAMSAPCKHCGKPLLFEDILITSHELKKRAVETYGNILVDKKGTCNADRIHCGSLEVRGKVNAHITSRGPVRVGPRAEIKGDVTAPAFSSEAGAILEGHYRIGPSTAPATPIAHPQV